MVTARVITMLTMVVLAFVAGLLVNFFGMQRKLNNMVHLAVLSIDNLNARSARLKCPCGLCIGVNEQLDDIAAKEKEAQDARMDGLGDDRPGLDEGRDPGSGGLSN